MQTTYVDALLNPATYVRGFGGHIGNVVMLLITAIWLWFIEILRKSPRSSLATMGGGILLIFLLDFALVNGWALYSDWTTVSILTILGWMFATIKETRWLSKVFK